ncbi:MAG: tetratricopeptide repeat protein [Thaumarchaeota archaeon]|nr:tetratricopeptide repeat protein [Nitrososphaerota archaeon]
MGNRRLAAIMFTDMVGYTALGQKNESLSLALVEQQRNLIRPILKKHNGREVKTMGDAFLIEFPSALEAIKCSYDIQVAIREFNFSTPNDEKIHLREGIHLGDVVDSNGDISGDAVNIASRIEPLADDGGISITRQVYDQVHNKFEEHVALVGLRKLKNVDSPVEVYKVVMPWESTLPQQDLNKKRLAVLPFINISPDPNDEFFSDGLTEEMITRLSELKGLEVIARTSIMNYKRTQKSITQIGHELATGVLLEGSVRKAGNRIRVTAQLIDCSTEGHLWAEKFDRDLGDIFAVQSEIAESVARSLKVKLLSYHDKDTDDVIAYTMYLKAVQLIHEETMDGLREAVKLLDGAISRDDNFARAYASLAYAWMGLTNFEEFTIDTEKARTAAQRALELEPDWAESHAAMASVYILLDRFGEALVEARKAGELNPNLADVQNSLGVIHTAMGELEQAVAAFTRATDLDPLSFMARFNLAQILFLSGREDDSLAASEKLKQLHPNNPKSYLVSAYLHSYRKDFEKAQAILDEGFRIDAGEHLIRLNQGVLYALSGRRKEAEDVLKLIENDKIESNRLIGRLYVNAALGNNEAALDALLRMAETHSWPAWVKSDPIFKELRTDKRFGEFCRKVGIPT